MSDIEITFSSPDCGRYSRPLSVMRPLRDLPLREALTPADYALIKAKWDLGLTGVQIAREIKGNLQCGREPSHGTIYAFAKEQGWERTGSLGKENQRLALMATRHADMKRAAATRVEKLVSGPVPDYRGVSIMALEAGMCKAVLGERDGEAVYCGHPCKTRQGARYPYESYCTGCRTSVGLPALRPAPVERKSAPTKPSFRLTRPKADIMGAWQ